MYNQNIMNNKNSQYKERSFSQISLSQRDRIQILLNQGYTQKEIALALECNQSTISRELKRKTKGVYSSVKAHNKASVLRSNSKYQGMKINKDNVLRKRIITELELGRSPDEIAGMLKYENLHIGKDAIYKWLYSVYGNRYCNYLCSRKVRRKKHKIKTTRTLIPNRISIIERPLCGIHAEADTLVSPKKAKTTACASMVVLQKTKLMLGHRMDNLKPQTMLDSVSSVLCSVSGIDDITFDNGIENRKHEQLPVRVFCTPHSPWEKPLVEQSIGLLRRWCIKKGVNLETVSQTEYQDMLNFLNHKKRKSLGYRSAYEVSYECGMITELPEKYAFRWRI